jgi:hypothetical protein
VCGNSQIHLSYRRSYFADPLKRESARDSLRAVDPLAYASQYGAPTSQEILFTAQLAKNGEPRAANEAEMDRLAAFGDPGQKSARSNVDGTPAVLVRDFVIHYSILPGALRVAASDNDGVQLEIATTAYDADGRRVFGVRGALNTLAAEEGNPSAVRYRANQAVILPATAASVRFAVLDRASGRIGSLQVSLPH